MTIRKRRVVTRSGSRVRGYRASTKSKRLIPWESKIEFDAQLVLEFDPSIKHFAEHQEEIIVQAPESTFRAYPDLIATPLCGEPFIIEVKSERDLRDEEVTTRLAQIERHYRALGIRYEVWSEQTIHQSPRIETLRNLAFYRRPGTKLKLLQISECQHLLSQSAELTLQEVASRVGNWHLAVRLLANDLLVSDFAEPLGPTMRVTIH